MLITEEGERSAGGSARTRTMTATGRGGVGGPIGPTRTQPSLRPHFSTSCKFSRHRRHRRRHRYPRHPRLRRRRHRRDVIAIVIVVRGFSFPPLRERISRDRREIADLSSRDEGSRWLAFKDVSPRRRRASIILSLSCAPCRILPLEPLSPFPPFLPNSPFRF